MRNVLPQENGTTVHVASENGTTVHVASENAFFLKGMLPDHLIP
jgi:hypothetical protein